MLWGYLYTLFERNKNKGSTSNQDSYSGGGGYYKVITKKYVGRTIFIVMQNEKERLGQMVGVKNKHDGHSDILDAKIYDRWDKKKLIISWENF